MPVDRAWVLLHGTPLDPGVWQGIAPVLGERQPVTAPSTCPMPDESQPQAAVAARIAEETPALADRWDLVGHSFGGQVAIELALLAPDRIASLSIICSRDTPFPPFAAAADNLRSGSPIDVDGTLARWFRPDELTSGHWLIDYARGQLAHADRDVWATALDGIAGYDRSDVIGSINAPTTLICAEADIVSDPTAMTAMRERLPDAQLHIVQGASHFSPLLSPAMLAKRLPIPP